jgi:hypothetical protein
VGSGEAKVIPFRPPVYDMVQTEDGALGILGEMKRRELTPEQATAVACPTCGAAVGERCELHSGGLRSKPHKDREFAAIDAIESKQHHSTRS